MEDAKTNSALEEFGKNLQRLRVERNLSLRKLAATADIEYALIHRIEKGKVNPKLTTILILAKALNISPKQLFNDIND
jgi:transcriptional regulator with XRE-family HTH domain